MSSDDLCGDANQPPPAEAVDDDEEAEASALKGDGDDWKFLICI